MKILFWFNGSGGQRRERKVVDFPRVTLDRLEFYRPEIENELDDWVHDLRSNSQLKRWGWDENFDPIALEPLTK